MAASAICSPDRLKNALACPRCRTSLLALERSLECGECRASYAVVNGILDLRPGAVRQKKEETDWTKHWSDSNQHSASQRFFSFYRKAVFARAVAYFIDRYLPGEGLLVEAGSGTSETSMLIDKRGGARTLMAL